MRWRAARRRPVRETNIQRQIMLALGSGPTRLFRNNVGTGWQGSMVEHAGGIVTLANARPLHAGLCKGSSDLIGWHSVVVTPEMVGRLIAVFVAIEVKSARGRAMEEQQRFIQAVRAAGGLAGLARSVDEARAILAQLTMYGLWQR